MFQRIKNSGSRFNGSSLQDYLDEGCPINKSILSNTFGQSDPGYWDEDKGYDGLEWCFECTEDETVYKVYARWGSWRIGSHNGTNVAAFKAWLLACVTPL